MSFSIGTIPIEINPKLLKTFLNEPQFTEMIFEELVQFTNKICKKPFSKIEFINGAAKAIAHHNFSLNTKLNIIVKMMFVLTGEIKLPDQTNSASIFTIDENNNFVKTKQFSKVIMHIVLHAWEPEKKDVIYIENLPHYTEKKNDKQKE